jgi:CxxC-x17-CxxC domain-containing protein
MHRATCAECGAECEVPFRPTGGKPVYCSNCFSNKEDSAPRRSNDRDRSRSRFASDRGERKMFEAVCDGCGKDCEVPFKPSEDKPVYCDECFGKNNDSRRGDSKRSESRGNASDNSLSKQIEALNSKLDKVIQLLTPKDKKEELIKLAPQGTKLAPKEIKKEKAVKTAVKKEVKKSVKKPVVKKAKASKKKGK